MCCSCCGLQSLKKANACPHNTEFRRPVIGQVWSIQRSRKDGIEVGEPQNVSVVRKLMRCGIQCGILGAPWWTLRKRFEKVSLSSSKCTIIFLCKFGRCAFSIAKSDQHGAARMKLYRFFCANHFLRVRGAETSPKMISRCELTVGFSFHIMWPTHFPSNGLTGQVSHP